MRISGIVCECNPPHAGHLYLMDRARADGADAVILVMSGCFTQRGEAAILSPRVRAQMLLSGGADAVFELPFPHCAAHGEAFGAAAFIVKCRVDGVRDLGCCPSPFDSYLMTLGLETLSLRVRHGVR